MESSTRNLIITLALPHLSREEDRVAFLAEQAALGALHLHGPEVAREALQAAKELLRDDFARHLIVEAITQHVAAAAQGDAAPPATESDASKPAPKAEEPTSAPMDNEASTSDSGYVISLESVDDASVDGAVRALASMAMTGGFAEEEAQKSARKWVARVHDGVPTAVARAESTQEADEACALLAAAGARALAVPAAKWKQHVVEKLTRTLLADGGPLAAVRYPAAPPEEKPAPAVVSPGYHVVLVSPGPLPNDKLVGAIANSVKDHGNGVGLPEQEALVYARQVVNANSPDDGVIVAHAASREDAEIVRKILHSTGVGVRAMVIPAVAKVPVTPEAQPADASVPQTPDGELPTPSAAEEDGDGQWHSVVMTGRGVPPYDRLVERLAMILLPSHAHFALRTKHHREMMARAEERLLNIDGPLEIARYESREAAEGVRSSILRNSSPGTMVKVVPAPRLNVTCCLFNEEWPPVAAPEQPGAATRELSMSGVTHKPAKKMRRSR